MLENRSVVISCSYSEVEPLNSNWKKVVMIYFLLMNSIFACFYNVFESEINIMMPFKCVWVCRDASFGRRNCEVVTICWFLLLFLQYYTMCFNIEVLFQNIGILYITKSTCCENVPSLSDNQNKQTKRLWNVHSIKSVTTSHYPTCWVCIGAIYSTLKACFFTVARSFRKLCPVQ